MKQFKFIIKTNDNLYIEEIYTSNNILEALLSFIYTSRYSVGNVKHIIML